MLLVMSMKNFLFLALIACGSTQTRGSGDLAAAPNNVARFHDTLASSADPCPVIDELTNEAHAIHHDAAPAQADPAQWAHAAQFLINSVDDLRAACGSTAAVTPAVEDVQQKYHALVAQVSGAPASGADH